MNEKLSHIETIVGIVSGIIGIVTFAIDFKRPSWYNRRYGVRLIATTLIVLVTTGLYYTVKPSLTIMICWIIIVLLFDVFLWKSSKSPILLAQRKLKKIDIWQENESRLLDDYERFPKRPWYFIYAVEKFEWNMRHIEWFISLNKYYDAYKAMEKTFEIRLLPKEIKKLQYKQAYILFNLGANKQATETLNKFKDDGNYKYHLLKAMANEQAGELTVAISEMDKAMNCDKKGSPFFMSEAYNAYGRIRKLSGNETDAYFFYRKAVNSIPPGSRHNELIHVCWQNLIFAAVKLDKNQDDIEQHKRDYKKQIDFNDLQDFLEYDNFQVEYMRQTDQMDGFVALSKETYLALKEKASPKQGRVLLVSSIRQIYNEKISDEFWMKELASCVRDILQSDIIEKIKLMHELWSFYDAVNPETRVRYNNVFEPIETYIRANYIKDIDSYIHTLDPIQISERAYLLSMKQGMLKHLVEPYPRKEILTVLQDVIDIYKHNGLFFEYIGALLNCIDECTYIQNRDRSHNPIEKDLMGSLLDKAKTALSSLPQQSGPPEYFLRIAYYEMFLKNKSVALEYLRKFNDSGLNVRHYANWLREYYNFLNMYKEELFDSLQQHVRILLGKILAINIPMPFNGTEQIVRPVLLGDGTDFVLVDCGFPGSLPLIEGALQPLGLTADAITHIVITHQDYDNMGTAAAFKAKYPHVKILASEIEEPYISGREKSLRLKYAEDLMETMPPEKRPFVEAFCDAWQNIEPVPVDIMLHDGDRFDWCGGCEIIATPGHAPGHISLLLPKIDAIIVGDAAVLEKGEPTITDPQFTPDVDSARLSIGKLLSYNAGRWICYHGEKQNLIHTSATELLTGASY